MTNAGLFAPAHLRAAWQRHTWGERQQLVEAFCWLGLARLLVLTLPFHWLLSVWRLHHQPLPVPLPTAWPAPPAHQAVEQIRCAIQAVSRYTPWHSNCLAQALTAHRMLQRRRLPSTLYLGVAKPAEHALAAHAWLCCGEQFVTGEPGWQRYHVLAVFGEKI